MEEIRESVGDGGENRQADVRVVQRLLLASGTQVRTSNPYLLDSTIPLRETGRCDHSTILHIEEFQRRNLGMRAGDPEFGLVSPGSATIFALNGQSGGTPPRRPDPEEPSPRPGQPQDPKRPGIRRTVYERREINSESGADTSAIGVLGGVVQDRIRGAGPVTQRRQAWFPLAYRVNAVRIRRHGSTTAMVGGSWSREVTQTWFTWGAPPDHVEVVEERATTNGSLVPDGPLSVRGPVSQTRRMIPREDLDQLLPRGQ